MTNILLLDVGNSRVKWTLARDGVMAPARAIVHGSEPAAAVTAIDADPVEAIWIANVTGSEHAAAMSAALQARFGSTPNFATPEAERLGIRSAYVNPQRLGVDRWLAMLAAWSRVRGTVCVASCGTALTFDAVDAGGQHLGGVIAPGLMTAQKAVLGATRFAAAGPDPAYTEGLGIDTEACVRQGALHACAGLLDRLSAAQSNASRFLSGGDAGLLQPHLVSPAWQLVPDLVLEGLLALSGQ